MHRRQHIEFGKLVSEERGARPGTDSERRHRVHRLHSGTTNDPKGVVHYHRYPIAYEGCGQ